MTDVTTAQLAQLLVGIARAQQAIIEAVDGQRAGFKMNYSDAAIERAAKLRNTQHTVTLEDFPARVLMQTQRRGGPDIEQLTKDLTALLAGQPLQPAAAPAAQAAPRPAAVAPAAPRPAPAAPVPAAAAAPAAPPAPRPQPAAPAAAPAPVPAPAPAPKSDNDLDMT